MDPATVTRHSTREIVTDAAGPKRFGHNPSWVKAVDFDALAAETERLRAELDPPVARLPSPKPLTCDGLVVVAGQARTDLTCPEPVTHLDHKGFAYCTGHGRDRQLVMRCRKLRPWELRRLHAGLPLKRY